MSVRRTLTAAGCALALLSQGCSSGSAKPQSVAHHSRPRVILVVEENHSFHQIVDSGSAPVFARMTGAGTLLTSYFAIMHPSLPNYIALLSGDTHGITSDCQDCFVNGPSIANQLTAAGITWKAYMEDLPAPCSQLRTAASYVRRHDPFMYFNSVRTDPALCRNVVPLEDFYKDLSSGTLPEFVWITPNLDHDMHGAAETLPNSPDDLALVSQADAWLGDLYDRLNSSGAWAQDTRLVVTFDEGLRKEHNERETCCNNVGAGGHIATVVVGPSVPHGVDNHEYTHYSLLRSLESLYHLPYLGHAATSNDIPVLSTP